MEKRSLGRCGFVVGEIGLGCEGLIGKSPEYVAEALGMLSVAGGNAIDLYSPQPEMRSNLGRAMRGRRADFLLQGHICTIWKDVQYKRTREMDEARQGFSTQAT